MVKTDIQTDEILVESKGGSRDASITYKGDKNALNDFIKKSRIIDSKYKEQLWRAAQKYINEQDMDKQRLETGDLSDEDLERRLMF